MRSSDVSSLHQLLIIGIICKLTYFAPRIDVVLVLVLSNRSNRFSKALRLQCQICKLLWVLNYRFFSAGVTISEVSLLLPARRRTCRPRLSHLPPRHHNSSSRDCSRPTTLNKTATAGGQQCRWRRLADVRSGGARWRSGGAPWRSGSGLGRSGGVRVRSESSQVTRSCTEMNC